MSAVFSLIGWIFISQGPGRTYCARKKYGRCLTINLDDYYGQTKTLSEALQEKSPALMNRGKVVFHHENARSHTSIQTRGNV